jgi:hypothetical protein
MGFLDRLLGREEPQQPQNTYPPQNSMPQGGGAQNSSAPERSEDEIAVERYRYLLRTAPPETIEQVHEEAFTKLTPDQRHLLFEQLSQNAPAGDQPRGEDAHSLAQSATRSELRQPGTLERSFDGAGRGGAGGMGFGSMVASSLLGTVAGYVIGSALVSAFLPDPTGNEAGADSGNDSGADGGNDSGDSGSDGGADAGGDASGGVSADGGGWGDSGGGGDFGGGGGDFGGGDFGGGFDF